MAANQAQYVEVPGQQNMRILGLGNLWRALGVPGEPRFDTFDCQFTANGHVLVKASISISIPTPDIVRIDHLSTAEGSPLHQNDLVERFCQQRHMTLAQIPYLVITNVIEPTTRAVFDQVYSSVTPEPGQAVTIRATDPQYNTLLRTPIGNTVRFGIQQGANALTLMHLDARNMAFWITMEYTAPPAPAPLPALAPHAFPPAPNAGPAPAARRSTRTCCVIM
ncbi:hypothetical protein AYO21_12112 [Fonsecaea monophora]|uniref:Uncharacterized protein n=1 Tax=Fonsecaea monophora TaxID=254056 RepID=A0A177EP82_9EURO|nr:hypothetical protein AYO21_12112 [Fonsecaea monophora]OAG33795.1 hypothetical protein AYO21_12112 [Fonsecaea monophora]